MELGRLYARQSSPKIANVHFQKYVEHCAQKQDIKVKEKSVVTALENALKNKQQKEAEALKSEYREIHNTLQSKPNFMPGSGPITSSLDQVLKSHGIEIQAFHSGAMNGNYCNKYLQRKVYQTLCEHIEIKVEKCLSNIEIANASHVDRIKEMMGALRRKIIDINDTFAAVHEAVSHCFPLGEPEGQQIRSMMDTYKTSFRLHYPGRVMPKHHFVEVHVPDWIDKWHVGLGLHGEQGLERIHSVFNSIPITFKCVQNPFENMTLNMNEHFVRSSPSITAGKPKSKRRKLFE